MREYLPLSPQPPYEAADTQSEEIHKLSPTCPSPLTINVSSPTTSVKDEALPSFRHRPMSTQTFPFDVFTNKGLKPRPPLQRRSSTISYISTDVTSTVARRRSIAFHPLSAARYAFNRSVMSFRSWSTSSWRRSSASINDLSSPPSPVPMTVDDYGPMLFYDIDDLVHKASQHAFNHLTQKLQPRDILHVGELRDFFTERENLEIEARLFDGSESEGMAPEENARKPYDVEDSLGSSILLYAGIRQCGGVAQRARGHVACDYWSTKDEVLMQSNRDALRAAFLVDREATKKPPEAKVKEQEEPVEEPVEELVVGGPVEEPVEET